MGPLMGSNPCWAGAMPPAKAKPPVAKQKDQQRQVLSDSGEMARVLRVGAEVMLQRELSDQRFAATLAGWVPGEAVIIHEDTPLGLSGELFRRNMLLVRFLSHGAIYGFGSRVLTTMRELSLIILEWPPEMEVVPLSQELRVACRQSATLRLDGERSLVAEMRDLSMAGCQVAVALNNPLLSALAAGSRLELSFRLPADQKIERLAAEVRNSRRGQKTMYLGLQFSPEQHDNLALIERIVSMQLVPA